MLNPFLKTFYWFSFLLIISCQPVEMTPVEDDFSDNSILFPSQQDEYKDFFLSDKLDLVFVLDTHSDMKSFYQKNFLGPDFLSRFQKYDWRIAYTDMSVDMNAFKQKKAEKEEKKEEEEESCGFWSGAVMTAAGVYTGGPLLSAIGLRNLFNCLSNISIFSEDEEDTAKSFTNGVFLPFEHHGKKLSYNGLNYMPKSIANYNEIFNHTVTLGNKKEEDYEAPEIKDQEAYPFLSTALSLVKGSRSLKANPHNETHPFFRKDSAIVYVLVTIHDMQVDITAKQFQESTKAFFNSKNRVRIIPVTLNSNPFLFCQLQFQKTSSSNSFKLRRLASKLGSSPLDICSQDLPDELFKEISKSLVSTDFLSD